MPAIEQSYEGSSPVQNRLLRLFAYLGIVLFVATASSRALESDPTVVDESVAIRIGTFDVSQYLVDKSYNQLVSTHRARLGGAPDQARVNRWFRLFVAQQSLKAWLSETGRVNRVEVQAAVAQMSRQILTQVDGALDRMLHRPAEISGEQLLAVHEMSARVFDALIVRFDDEQSVNELLARNPASSGLEKRLRALIGSPTTPRSDAHEGEIVWPYHPFEEISAELANAQQGRLIGPLSRQLGTYFLLVRGESRQTIPDFDAARQRLERHLGELDRIMARRIRKRQIIKECRVSLDAEAIAQFWNRLAPANRGRAIPENAIAGAEGKPLVTYLVRGERRQITERSFVADLNRRFAATTPQDGAALATAIESLVIEDYDYETAIGAGLHREPKFMQDQRNFELSHALALYEKEVLVPQIAVSHDELQRHYAEHRDQYLVPFEATGALYVFATEKLAQQGLRKLLSGEATITAARFLDPIVVRRDGPPVIPGVPNLDLLAIPDDQRFGPVKYSDGFAIFAKRDSGARQALPLAEIESVVRSDVLRAKLNEMEVDIFQRNGAGRTLQLELDLSKYGLEDSFSLTPLERRQGEEHGNADNPTRAQHDLSKE